MRRAATRLGGICVAVLAVLASGCAQRAGQTAAAVQIAAQAAEAGPPLVDGLYILPGACPGEGCQLGAWIARSAGDLRERPDQDAPVTAYVAEGENVEAIASLLRLKPVRGVVVREEQGLVAGDVVYLLDSEGEGFFTLWRRGEQLTWSWPSTQAATVDEATGIDWDRPEAAWSTPEAPGALEGWWVHIRGAHGQSGWTRERGYECRPVASDPGHCQLM